MALIPQLNVEYCRIDGGTAHDDRIVAIDWAREGLCPECIKDKTDEWRGEQKAIWDEMGAWIAA